jgi:hypothetical protein
VGVKTNEKEKRSHAFGLADHPVSIHLSIPNLSRKTQGAHYTETLRSAHRPGTPTRPYPGCTASASLHALADVPRRAGGGGCGTAAADWDYCFLSPVWPSVSKPGHAGGLPPPQAIAADLAASPPAVPVLALGGLTPATARRVAGLGCAGAAVIGSVWEAGDRVAAWAAFVSGLDAGLEEEEAARSR